MNEVRDEIADLTVEERSELHLVLEQEEETSVARKYAAEAEQAIQEKALTALGWEKRASRWRLGTIALAAMGIIVGLAALLSNYSVTSKPNQPRIGVAVRSIAVLPFKPLSSDGSDEYLDLGWPIP